VKVFVYSQKGNENKICEDAALVLGNVYSDSFLETEMDEKGIIAIADGVGGNAGGEYASRYVLNELKKIPCHEPTVENLKKHIVDIDSGLLQYALTMPGKENMATTMTGILLASDKHFLFHIGNCRIYIMQGNYLKQYTQDQTTYQWLINIGQNDSARVCNKSEITYCMGGGNRKFAEGIQVWECDGLKACRRILLTTDGVHDYLSLDELEEFITGKLSKETIQDLAKKATSKGSVDDKTIMVIDRM
jgi:protein phosphatase